MRWLELYCGIGGFSAAANGRNWQVVRAIDINQIATRVYADNFGPHAQNLTLESVTADWLAQQQADGWWLSPPCQPFTPRGKQRGEDDTRSSSLAHLLELLPVVQPAALALENVPEFASSAPAKQLCEILHRCGYQVHQQVLCPTELGIPNRRRRYYLVASRSGLLPLTPPSTSLQPLTNFLDPSLRQPPVNRRLQAAHSPTDANAMDCSFTALAVDPRIETQYARAIDVVSAHPAAISACFTAAYGKSPIRSGSYLATEQGLRRFSPREVLNFLGFPAEFRWPAGVSMRQAWKLAGNSLSVHAVRYMLQAIEQN